MIVVKMSGGLGNQMFQYALFLKFQSLGRDVRIDTSWYKTSSNDRNLELAIFSVPLESVEITSEELRAISTEKIHDKLLRYITLGNYSRRLIWYQDKIDVFQPDIFSMENVYLEGYWQNQKYFEDIKPLILDTFVFPEDVREDNNLLVRDMRQENSVSIHIRRGDYINIANQGVYGDICTKDYYQNAIDYIERHVENPHYYLFSDDIEWVRDNLYQQGMTIVEDNRADASYKDMFLMSQCRHHIIANSTFSWWGAWLGDDMDKIVVAPTRWFQNHETTDIICKGWVRIGRDAI